VPFGDRDREALRRLVDGDHDAGFGARERAEQNGDGGKGNQQARHGVVSRRQQTIVNVEKLD
jgi:hypothetical protein